MLDLWQTPCPPPRILKALDYSRAFLFSAGLIVLLPQHGLFAVLSHKNVKVKVSVAADVRKTHPQHCVWPTFPRAGRSSRGNALVRGPMVFGLVLQALMIADKTSSLHFPAVQAGEYTWGFSSLLSILTRYLC